MFVALQAGGSATMNPHTAPAGDEILRSAGWTDDTPDPSIAQLNTTPVQQSPGGAAPQVSTTSEPVPPSQMPVDAEGQAAAIASPGAGARAGIETTRIEQ